MQVLHHTKELRNQIKSWRADEQSICLVPTMGNLHSGHLALVDRAKQLADRVVATVFVNPTQFGKGEDFDSYPRTLEADSLALAEHDTDVLFAPPVNEVYPTGLDNNTEVSVPSLDGILCGESRPIHFTGVATVVTKLFNLVQPDFAIFGEKDYQQLLVIKRMTLELCMPIQIYSLPTVREEDGLAKSSRNGYLSAEERAIAPALYKELSTIASELQQGNTHYKDLEDNANENLRKVGFEPEYMSIRRQEDLVEAQADDHDLVVLAASRLGKTRLIDNIQVSRNN